MRLTRLLCNAGTNVMIRARAAFGVSRFAKQGFQSDQGHCQVYSEDEISEDIELGARIHAAGYKSVFVPNKLATGEVCISGSFAADVVTWPPV
jgi:cellulose synthase/poly-beta-1,6-N-acetylglucosamine synthase-like glycosyltransferase